MGAMSNDEKKAISDIIDEITDISLGSFNYLEAAINKLESVSFLGWEMYNVLEGIKEDVDKPIFDLINELQNRWNHEHKHPLNDTRGTHDTHDTRGTHDTHDKCW